MRRVWYSVLYYISWLLFAVFGVLLSLACVPLLPLAGRPGPARLVRVAMHRLFRLYCWWFRTSGVVQVRWSGAEAALESGCVYIANHPSLLDAVFMIARIPDAICILKPALLRNPAIGAAARVAGFEPGDNLIDLVHRASRAVAAGRALIVFPEGTRTEPGRTPGAFRNGFALIAERARRPVRIITIRCSEGFVPRGRAWWRPATELPCWVHYEVGPLLQPADYPSASAFGRACEQELRAALDARTSKAGGLVSTS